MKIIVIGAGATGLAAAYLLARSGHDVTIVEATTRPGGLLSTFEFGDGHRLEYFYHHFFTHDDEINWLLGELGLSHRIFFRKTTMGMFGGGRLYRFDNARDLLGFGAISLPARLRFGFSSAMLAYLKRHTGIEDVSAARWFERWAGREATESIWLPLLRVKFGEAARDVPLAWMACRFRQRALSRKRGEESLGYLEGSLQVLVDTLVDTLERHEASILLDTPIRTLLMKDGHVVGVDTPAGEIRADKVVSTIPTKILADIVRPIDSGYSRELDRIEYLGAVCIVLALTRPLSSIYWTNVLDPEYDFGGVIEQTNFIPPEKYGGKHLVYLSRYLRHDHELWKAADDQLVASQCQQLDRMYRRDVRSDIEKHWVFRGRFAAPLTDMGLHTRMPRFKAPIQNLYVASMCHIYPEERSVNNSIRVAAEVVREMGMEEAADLVPRGVSLAAKYGR